MQIDGSEARTNGHESTEGVPAGSNHLPDWNDLPNECREAMVKAAGWFTEDWEAGQCALDMYIELKKTFPAQTFPLFERTT